MKHPFRSRILPHFTLGAGLLGLVLRIWLFSDIDEKGLLPAGHPADSALYILTALTLGILCLATRELTSRKTSKGILRPVTACAYVLGGLGLLFDSLLHFSGANVRLAGVAMVGGFLGGIVMLCMAALLFMGKKPVFWMHAVLTVVLMLDTVAQCQVWGAEPQLQAYFFPLLASIFLILTGYQATSLAAGQGKIKLLAFFSQCALFFCCVSLNTAQWPLYLGMLFWAAVQFFPCILPQKEA